VAQHAVCVATGRRKRDSPSSWAEGLPWPGAACGYYVCREAAVLLAQILGYLANGEGVNVMPDSAELTTQQAAEFLNVSRPYLIKLLETEQIPFRRVGTHRRIRFRDLRLYRSRDDMERRQAADELTQLSQDLGLY
jgi:excisionase family DNA binding protein